MKKKAFLNKFKLSQIDEASRLDKKKRVLNHTSQLNKINTETIRKGIKNKPNIVKFRWLITN